MKALSIRQPWAWAILHAGKDVENRDWQGCSFRGPLLLHAAKGCTRSEYEEAVDFIGERRRAARFMGEIIPPLPPLEALDRGGIVGVCQLVQAVKFSPSPWFFGPLGLRLAHVHTLPFVPFKGALGFFDVPPGWWPVEVTT